MSLGYVLVIEDDRAIRHGLIDTFADHGYEAIGVANGDDALAALRDGTKHPCLIILDVMMPVMDGEKFRAEQMRDSTIADIPVVLVSAHRNVAEQAKILRAAAYLEKPLKVEDLLALAQQYC